MTHLGEGLPGEVVLVVLAQGGVFGPLHGIQGLGFKVCTPRRCALSPSTETRVQGPGFLSELTSPQIKEQGCQRWEL